jgi:PilZ domain
MLNTLDQYRVRIRARSSQVNRRRSIRAEFRVPIEYRNLLKRNEPPRWAVAENLSTGGIAFITDHPLKKGNNLCVRLETDDPAGLPLPAVVRHCRPVGTGQWMVGCRFSIPVSPQHFEALTRHCQLLEV